MTRRLIALLILATVLVTSSLAPDMVLATDPDDDVSVRSSSGRLLPPMPDELQLPSVHAEMLADQGSGTFDFEPGGAPTVLLDERGAPRLAVDSDEPLQAAGAVGTTTEPPTAAGLPNGLHKEVFGFLPYWMLTDSALAELRYSLVSTIAYFSVNVNRDGDLVKGSSSGWAGWTSSRMTQVLDRAHAKGVKVVLTVTMMAWDSTSAAKQERVLTSSARRTRLVNQIVNAIRNRGADGVNLDFEPVATSLRDEYVALVRELKAALQAAGVGDFLTVCVMAGAATWATGYDVAGLTSSSAADALFVMGYDYHWSGSSRAGGVAPIHSPYTLDVDGTMLDFLSETSGSKLIWGVPYYGRTWRTTKKTVNSPTIAGGSRAYTYTGHRLQAAQYGKRWDDVGKVPWYRYWDGGDGNWVQGYYDSPRSLGVKYDLINARGLAGTGMWTLLMDQGRDELWQLLAEKFVRDSAPPVGGIRLLPPATDGLSVKVGWKATDHGSGVDRYNVQVRPVGGSWELWLKGTEKTSAWFSGEIDRKYEFRVKAIDNMNNAQEWVNVPGKPGKVKAGAFARVVVSALNVRSGPGTGYDVIAQAERDDRVYVLEGPVAGSGLQWFRVQYGFREWPSSESPQIGWMAVGSDVEDYMKPALAPTITKLSPFVRYESVSSPFSPNGDGRQDVARVEFTMADAASVRLEIVDASGEVVRTSNLGSVAAGSHVATWNGRTASGAIAAEGRYLPRIVAVEGTVAHYAPARGVDADMLKTFGVRLDLTRPRVDGHEPVAGEALVPVTDPVVVDFSERMRRVGAANVYVATADGDVIPARNARKRDGRRVEITPDGPLPVGAELTVVVSKRPMDAAGNPSRPWSWSFRTAPGTAYDPWRGARLKAGTHTAYHVSDGGKLSSPKSATFDSVVTAQVGQRASLPNLPGRWLHVESGAFADRWIRESPRVHLPGEADRWRLDPSTRIVLRKGKHTGLRFDDEGNVTSTLRGELDRKRTPRVRGRWIVNGTAYFRVASGKWSGYLVRESRKAFLPSAIKRIDFPDRPRVVLSAGTYTGVRFDDDWRVVKRVTATLDRSTRATTRAWAVINGAPHFKVTDGTWAGTWVPETAGIRMDA